MFPSMGKRAGWNGRRQPGAGMLERLGYPSVIAGGAGRELPPTYCHPRPDRVGDPRLSIPTVIRVKERLGAPRDAAGGGPF